MTDLLFFRGSQHALPDGMDDLDVLVPCSVAMGLDNMSQSQAANHSFQNLLHMAEGQVSLGVGGSFYQLHFTGYQSNLARTEHHVIDLEKKYKEKCYNGMVKTQTKH